MSATPPPFSNECTEFVKCFNDCQSQSENSTNCKLDCAYNLGEAALNFVTRGSLQNFESAVQKNNEQTIKYLFGKAENALGQRD